MSAMGIALVLLFLGVLILTCTVSFLIRCVQIGHERLCALEDAAAEAEVEQ